MPTPSSGQTAEHGIDTAAIRDAHTRGEVVIGEGYCRRDKLPWPCDAIRLADALDRQREEIARLREQNLATDHDAFAALEAENARLRAEVLERDVLVGMMRDDNNSIHDTAKFHAEQAEQLRRELRAAESREAQEKAQADTWAEHASEEWARAEKAEQQRDNARALLRSQTDNVIATERLADGLAQQRDDALACLAEVRALHAGDRHSEDCNVLLLYGAACSCWFGEIRAILDRPEAGEQR